MRFVTSVSPPREQLDTNCAVGSIGEMELSFYCRNTRYTDELNRNEDVLHLMGDLRQSGRAVRIDETLLRTEEDRLPAWPTRRSNDPHVLALAAAGRATVLFSCDSNLQADFRDSRVIPNVGTRRRRSLPLRINQPQDRTGTRQRRRFLDYRRCESPR